MSGQIASKHDKNAVSPHPVFIEYNILNGLVFIARSIINPKRVPPGLP